MKYFNLEETPKAQTRKFYQWWDQLMSNAFNGSPITMTDPKMGSPKLQGRFLNFCAFKEYCKKEGIIQ